MAVLIRSLANPPWLDAWSHPFAGLDITEAGACFHEGLLKPAPTRPRVDVQLLFAIYGFAINQRDRSPEYRMIMAQTLRQRAAPHGARGRRITPSLERLLRDSYLAAQSREFFKLQP